jgi:quinoprotein glucose dehydrogenase
MTRRWAFGACVAFALAVSLAGGAEPPVPTVPADVEWRAYGHDAGGMRYSPLAQIDRGNVARLARAWTYHTGDAPPAGRDSTPFEATPVMARGVLYFTTPYGRVIALDAEDGTERWTFDPRVERTGAPRHRGVAYWEDAGATDRRILVGTEDGRLFALDASTGAPVRGFGSDGAVDLRPQAAGHAAFALRSPPAIYRDLAIVGSALQEWPAAGAAGDVRALDVRTGREVWRFHTVPRDEEAGRETWPAGESGLVRSGANAWSIASVDAERGLVFLPLGSPTYDFYGGDRAGANLYGNSLVVLDAATGARRWHFQAVHHDLWDYDLPAQPLLATVTRAGQPVDVVVQVTKMGLVFAFDRATGEPLFSIEERPVPPSVVPGEAAWPTQPFPAKPPPLVRHAPLTKTDITTVTPESHRFCADLFDRLTSGGLYTPLGTTLTLFWPGNLGGATWSGASFDPATGYLFVNLNELGAVGEMRRQPPGAPLPWRRGSDLARGEYARFWDPDRLPCQQPPWGTLAAVDLQTGEVAWQVPLGSVPALEARGVTAVTGSPSLGGSIVTAGGLVFIGGTGDARFRAFDARTGALAWSAPLEASAHATPMTYRAPRSGRQMVVVAAGGGGYLSETTSDVVVAFALPDAKDD